MYQDKLTSLQHTKRFNGHKLHFNSRSGDFIKEKGLSKRIFIQSILVLEKHKFIPNI